MTTYNTGNPVPSTDVRDLYDNAENLDNLVNGPAVEYNDRLGVPRKSWAGMESDFDAAQLSREADFQQFLLESGYTGTGVGGAIEDYDSGPLNITGRNQIFVKDGEYWRAAAALVLPYTTIENWATDQTNFVNVGDAVLRQDLSNAVDPAKGSGIPTFNIALAYPPGSAGAQIKENKEALDALATVEGAGDVGHSDAETYAPNTVGYAIRSARYFSGAPDTINPLEMGIVVGDQQYDPETIGAGSILLGGWRSAGGQYNRLPGTRNLRMILGGYDNEITAGTGGDDGGLACIIVGSHHSEIQGAATHATVVGGSNHAMLGDYSAFVGGTLSEGVVGADFALTTGLRARTRWGGSHTMGMGFTAAGDMQTVRATLRALTTNATPTEISTTSAGTSRLTTVDNSVMEFDIIIVGIRTDSGSESASYRITGTIKRGVGVATTAFAAAPVITVIHEDDATWNVGLVASTSSGVLVLTVTGAVGKTIRWGGRIDMVEVSF